jgi:hypothetical protein
MEVTQGKTIDEAWELGMQQGLTKVALNMLREGIDLALIAKLTGLSLANIQNLQTKEIEEESLVQDFLTLNDSSLNKIWMNEEEEEAWKNL